MTIELAGLHQRRAGAFERVLAVLKEELEAMLPEGKGTILVAALGNRAITPDALGPLVHQRLLITRHLAAGAPELFASLRSVAAVSAGVLGTTGVESRELIRAAVELVKPVCVIAVDALAARSAKRLCAAVQLTDAGIAPGSGVGNHRPALNEESLGVKVIGVGVPTVVDAKTLALDILEEAGMPAAEETLAGVGQALFVTPRDIDEKVALCAKVVGYAINLAAQREMKLEELQMLVE